MIASKLKDCFIKMAPVGLADTKIVCAGGDVESSYDIYAPFMLTLVNAISEVTIGKRVAPVIIMAGADDKFYVIEASNDDFDVALFSAFAAEVWDQVRLQFANKATNEADITVLQDFFKPSVMRVKPNTEYKGHHQQATILANLLENSGLLKTSEAITVTKDGLYRELDITTVKPATPRM